MEQEKTELKRTGISSIAGVRTVLPWHQLSLAEVIFTLTFLAVLMGLEGLIGTLAVSAIGGVFVVVGLLRLWRPSNYLLGGLGGYIVAGAVALLISWMQNAQGSDMSILLLCVCLLTVGYVAGQLMAVFEDYPG
ncbi:MAG: hypothetical protein KDB03_13390 [Planctomycetales bacterium]|nr:hypothetical protein [Planctomycetales bacterium]